MSTDSITDSRPAKRARSELTDSDQSEDDVQDPPPNNASTPSESFVRDSEFWQADGSLILEKQIYVFENHKSIY